MKFLDLFAGIGGVRLGLERAGHECVGYVEWDKYARKSYEAIHNTEGEWTRNDITAVTDNEWRELRGKVDIIAGGFPCQSFSIAGKREGFADKTKGTLFFEIVRAAKQIQPQLLFLENVKGLLNHDKGNTFRTILSTLDELGYDAEWQVLNSKDFGVPQNRERVFIIGHFRNGRGREVFPIQGSYGQVNQNDINQINDNHKIKETIGFESINRFYDVEGISPCLNTMSGGGREPKIMVVGNIRKNGTSQSGQVVSSNGLSPTLCASGLQKDPVKVLVREPKIMVHKLQQSVRVRKNTCDIEELKELLKSSKVKSNKTLSEIAEFTKQPKTKVEHWFRKDDSFSIPDPDVWFKLKELLKITTNDFDSFITEFIEKPNLFEKSSRVYDERGIAPTLTKTGADEKVLVREATKKGYAVAEPGDSINFEHPNSKTRRGRVGKGIANTLTTSCNQGVLIGASRGRNPDNPSDRRTGSPTEQRLEINQDGVSNTLTTVQKDNLVIIDDQGRIKKHYKQREIVPTLRAQTHGNPPKLYDGFRIRKLTPLECFRLQGFPDEAFRAAEQVNSNSQLYKQAGNSVTVNVIEAIANRF